MEGGTSVREQPVMPQSYGLEFTRSGSAEKAPAQIPLRIVSCIMADDTDLAKPSMFRPRLHKASCHHGVAAGRTQMSRASAIAVGHELHDHRRGGA
jgi:hypothetical protein